MSSLPFFMDLRMTWIFLGRARISHLSSTGKRFLVAMVYLYLFLSTKFLEDLSLASAILALLSLSDTFLLSSAIL